MRRAILFINGKLRSLRAARAVLGEDDYLVAVDGGLRYIHGLGLTPHVLIGDLDSVEADLAENIAQRGCQVIRYPEDKDETDLELALGHVGEKGFRRICIVAALGGRLDQTLANIFLLTQKTLHGIDIRLDDGIEEVFVVHHSTIVEGQAGDLISLIPLSETVTKVRTSGLQYPLRDETLIREKTRGISNKMLTDRAQLEIGDGVLLCVHMRTQRHRLR